MGLTLMTLFLVGMCLEVAREAYHPRVGDWAARHYPRMMIMHELPWWAERKTVREVREHRRRWHIDLLGRTRIKELKK